MLAVQYCYYTCAIKAIQLLLIEGHRRFCMLVLQYCYYTCAIKAIQLLLIEGHRRSCMLALQYCYYTCAIKAIQLLLIEGHRRSCMLALQYCYYTCTISGYTATLFWGSYGLPYVNPAIPLPMHSHLLKTAYCIDGHTASCLLILQICSFKRIYEKTLRQKLFTSIDNGIDEKWEVHPYELQIIVLLTQWYKSTPPQQLDIKIYQSPREN